MKERRFQFIVNPKAGTKRKAKVVDQLKNELDDNISYGINFTEHAAHATELAQAAVQGGAEAVVAIGGDGTVNEVAKALIGTDVKLGVIPMGSGNGFARHMEIPLKVGDAIQCLNRGKSRLIDTGEVNGEPFLSTVGLGFDALVGKEFADFGKRGLFSYMQVSTNVFLNFKIGEYHLFVDGEEIKTKAFVINFANIGQYGNNAWIAPQASVSDGKLNVCILEPFPQHMVGDIIIKLFNKHLDRSKYYRSILAEKIEVISPSLYHIDGEPRDRSKLEVKVVPGSLRVIC